jgi:hypothetical protein
MSKPLAAVARLALLALACAAALPARAEPARPKLVVFDLELDDFTAGGPIAGESPAETARLTRMTELARNLLAQSNLFELVDAGASQNDSVKAHWLRKCNGCDADAARDLGADLSFVGYFRKISVMEQFLEFLIRDARTGEVVNLSHTDLRNETDDSWRRALTYLLEKRLIEPERARRERESAQ